MKPEEVEGYETRKKNDILEEKRTPGVIFKSPTTMNVVKLLLYITTVSAAVVTLTKTGTIASSTSSSQVTKKVASSSSRAQILPTGTPPMFASAKNAIISNMLSISIPSAAGYLAKEVEPTSSAVPTTTPAVSLKSYSTVSNSTSSITTGSHSVSQVNSVSKTDANALYLTLSVVLVACLF